MDTGKEDRYITLNGPVIRGLRRFQRTVLVVAVMIPLLMGVTLWRYQEVNREKYRAACEQRNKAEVWRRNLLKEQARLQPTPEQRAAWHHYLDTAPPIVDCGKL